MRTDKLKIKWHGKKISIFGYLYNPFFNTRKASNVVQHFVGNIEDGLRVVKFPMWIKEFEDGDKRKSLLGNTGILVDIPKK